MTDQGQGSLDILNHGAVYGHLQSVVEMLAQQSVDYLYRTGRLYYRVPEQLREELQQVGWLAVCEWINHHGEERCHYVLSVPLDELWQDDVATSLCESVRSRMNAWLFQDQEDRWIELGQDERELHLADQIERGQS